MRSSASRANCSKTPTTIATLAPMACRRRSSAELSAERIYAITGIQFLNFNSLFQLYAANRATPKLLRAATAFVTIPDLLNYWLTGRLAVRVHDRDDDPDDRRGATFVGDDDARRSRSADALVPAAWSSPARSSAGFDTSVSASLADTPVVAPACHDTGSAFASVRTERRRRVSQFGHVVASGRGGPRTRHLGESPGTQFHERGRRRRHDAAAQEHRRSLAAPGVHAPLGRVGTARVVRRSARGRARRSAGVPLGLRSGPHQLFQPGRHAGGDGGVLPPDRSGRTRRTARLCASDSRKPGAQVPLGARVAGGIDRPALHAHPHRRRRIAQPPAQSVHRGRDGPSRPGRPVEATALGNIAMQLVATGSVRSLAEAREIIDQSFPVERFDPVATDRWTGHYSRFQEYREVMGV